jgi:hypothetical protein
MRTIHSVNTEQHRTRPNNWRRSRDRWSADENSANHSLTTGCAQCSGLLPVNAPGCDRPRLRSGSCFLPRQMEAVPMAKSNTKRKRTPKHVLKLPDLEQSKSAVLNSLTSRSSQRTYDHAIREFIEWYCSEPRLAFNKTVVTRYRIFLEQLHYASTTINLRLAAIWRLAYEAADCGLLSTDLAAGIRRVKGAKRLRGKKPVRATERSTWR